ncbi:MAG: ABC transporter ATP-binding protein [Aromatoleum sp.]|jgi:branched-chain amino acid transport system permease protein|uniref:ABC transporter permease subunit n=1 Tax=Aromatoleum sp. TaxID=2307007 RepID=UPI002895EAA4|nr:ABC transporter ATP-binding protein [Aromatoleum sp.]MDT3672532.1 ABC transporter ATP-binding protein [Aromatoleum sp.]
MNELALAVPWLGKRNPQAARWLIVVVALAAPLVAILFGRTWVRVLDFALLYVMLALGLNLVVGFAGLLDLGYIAFYAVGAYTFAFLASPHFDVHLPFWVVLPLAAGFAALAGIMLGFPVLRLRGDYLAIVTLGFGEIVRIFMNNLNYPINITNGPQGINALDPLVLFGWDLSRNIQVTEDFSINSLFLYYYFFLACVAGSVIFIQRLQVSRVGRAWAAMRDDELAAKAIGINTRNLKLLAFSLGATFGGVAGALFGSFQGFVSPESFSLMESIAVLTMVVFGGMGNVAGAIVGALILSALPEILRHLAVPMQQALFGTVILDPEVLRMLLLSLAMILMMLLKPAGLIPAHPRYSRVEHLSGREVKR